VIARVLRRDGHEVVTAATMTEAVAASRGRKLDLLIADLGLPDGSGNDLMMLMRKTHGVRGIALSGYGMETDVAGAAAAGFATHATKPVDVDTLRDMIRSVMDGATRSDMAPPQRGPARDRGPH
jgi:DNA-binding response OmpR family regulator